MLHRQPRLLLRSLGNAAHHLSIPTLSYSLRLVFCSLHLFSLCHGLVESTDPFPDFPPSVPGRASFRLLIPLFSLLRPHACLGPRYRRGLLPTGRSFLLFIVALLFISSPYDCSPTVNYHSASLTDHFYRQPLQTSLTFRGSPLDFASQPFSACTASVRPPPKSTRACCLQQHRGVFRHGRLQWF